MEVENEAISKLIKQIDDAPNGLWDEINFFNAWSRKVLLLNGFSEIDLISYRFFPRKMSCGWKHLSPRMLDRLKYLGNRKNRPVPTTKAKSGDELNTAVALRIYATSSYFLKFGLNRFGEEAYSTIFLKETRQLTNQLSFINLYQSSQGSKSASFKRESKGIEALMLRYIKEQPNESANKIWGRVIGEIEQIHQLESSTDDGGYFIEIDGKKIQSYTKILEKEDGASIAKSTFIKKYNAIKRELRI